jgi:hypothetical protein
MKLQLVTTAAAVWTALALAPLPAATQAVADVAVEPSDKTDDGRAKLPPSRNDGRLPRASGPAGASPSQSGPRTWFDGWSLGRRSMREPSSERIELVSAEPQAVVPQLGPLSEEPEVIAPAPIIIDEPLEGPIVDLTAGAPPSASYAPMHSFSGEPYDLHLMPQGLIYRSYMAGAKESRFRSLWHEEDGGHDIWDISLGGSVGILRFGTRGDTRPEGMQLGIEGAGLTRLDRDEEFDVAATDYRFGIPLTWGDSIYQVKLAYYHLSSHVGDEFIIKNPTFNRVNYSRDVLVWGHSLYPTEKCRVYGEIGYAFYNDVSEPWELQFGVDYGPNGRTGARGAPFAAFNGHLREEVDYGGNFVCQTGWAWRRSAASGLFRMGVEYYNGKEDQFSYFNQSVEKIGLGLWYDY